MVVVKIADLKDEFNSRVEVDEDRMLQFAILMEDGVAFPPIRVWQSRNLVVDGRTRIAACKYLGREEIAVDYKEYGTLADALIDAYQENLSQGPKPPSEADTRHTIRVLFREGMSRTDITANLSHQSIVAPKYLRQFVDAVASEEHARLVNLATADVANGHMSAKDAAEKHGVPVDDVKALLTKRRREAKSEGAFTKLRNQISTGMTNFSHQLGHYRRRVDELLEMGEITVDEARSLLEHIHDRAMHVQRTHRKGLAELSKKRPDLSSVTDAHPMALGVSAKAPPREEGRRRTDGKALADRVIDKIVSDKQ